MFELTERDVVVACRPEYAHGPGWANQPLWVYVKRDGVIREECLQPEDQTPVMAALFQTLSAAQAEMIAEVVATMKRRQR